MTISSWLNFGGPTPPGSGYAAGRNFGSALLYSHRRLCASMGGLRRARSVCVSLNAFSCEFVILLRAAWWHRYTPPAVVMVLRIQWKFTLLILRPPCGPIFFHAYCSGEDDTVKSKSIYIFIRSNESQRAKTTKTCTYSQWDILSIVNVVSHSHTTPITRIFISPYKWWQHTINFNGLKN